MTDDPAIAHTPRLVLASSSPQRRQLLMQRGYHFEVIAPSPAAEGDIQPGESADQLVLRLARQKAKDVSGKVARGIVVGCDTVALCGGIIMGKPGSREDARRMLQLMSGQEHQVLSGLCLWQRPEDSVACQLATTSLVMEQLDKNQLDKYLDTNKWEGKAGGFGYQDNLDWIRIVEGSEANVVGLPLELLEEMLSATHPSWIPGSSRAPPS